MKALLLCTCTYTYTRQCFSHAHVRAHRKVQTHTLAHSCTYIGTRAHIEASSFRHTQRQTPLKTTHYIHTQKIFFFHIYPHTEVHSNSHVQANSLTHTYTYANINTGKQMETHQLQSTCKEGSATTQTENTGCICSYSASGQVLV